MVQLNRPNYKHSDTSNLHHSVPHLSDAPRDFACDHCTYFKGVVYRAAIRQQLTGDEELVVRSNNMVSGPRSLESIALAEEEIEMREQAEYMAFCQSRTAINDVLLTNTSMKAAKKTSSYSEPSNTLAQWLETSTKEELLSWLEKRNNTRDDMDKLRQAGIFDLRDYILHSRHARPTPKKSAAPSRKSSADAATTGQSCIPELMKQSAQSIACGLRLQAHKSLKPPQAALRQREELRKWYECRKAPELKDECRQRGLRPLPAKKAAMVEALVEDDKKGV